MSLAREFCTGKTIDDAPAIAHALKVTHKLSEHVPGIDPQLAAATILHDSPELAPKDIDLDGILLTRFGDMTLRVVRSLEREHHHLDHLEEEALDDIIAEQAERDRDTLYASTADKIVSFRSLLQRARRSGDPDAFFGRRRGLAVRIPSFRRYADVAQDYIPPDMAIELNGYVTRAEIATLAIRQQIAAEAN